MIFPSDFKLIISDLKTGIDNGHFYEKYGFNKYVGIKVRKSKNNNFVDFIVVTWNREKAIYDNKVDLNKKILTYIGAGLEGEQSGKRQNKSLIDQFGKQSCPIILASKIGKELKYICMLFTENLDYLSPVDVDNSRFKFQFRMNQINYKNLHILLNVIPQKKPAWVESNKAKIMRKKDTFKRIISDQKLRDLLKELQFIGDIGEIIAFYYEVDRLNSIGLSKFAKLVEHISLEKGHGFGYDIKSYDYDDNGVDIIEIFIEVKSTVQGETSLFSLTKNEYDFFKEYEKNYRIYRVYDIYESEESLIIHKYPFERLEFKLEETYKYVFKTIHK